MDIDLNETIAQLGGIGLSGALAYTGTQRIVKGENYVGLFVNSRPGYTWAIKITLDSSDTYTLELIASRDMYRECLYMQKNVYCDELQLAVEQMYDRAINEHNRGLIPLR